jgi:hypothetical protein
MPVAAWIPIVEELNARGVTDAVTVVAVLATYDLPLASGEQIWGKLPRAFNTVASVTGRDVLDLKTGYVARSASAPTAGALVDELKALAPKLDRLPGVSGSPRFVGFEPARLAIYTRMLATQEGIPIPATSRASPEWVALLQALRSRGADNPDVAQFVLLRARLRLKSGVVIEPLDEDARYLTVATAYNLDPAKFRQEFFTRMMEVVPGSGMNPVAKAKEARAVLASLPDVDRVEEVAMALPPPPVKPYRDGDELIAPPWEAFPEAPSSLRWRMGAGEDYLDKWLPFWRGLPEKIRRDYLTRHPPSAEWREWLTGT